MARRLKGELAWDFGQVGRLLDMGGQNWVPRAKIEESLNSGHFSHATGVQVHMILNT
jgi:hypothetical protein